MKTRKSFKVFIEKAGHEKVGVIDFSKAVKLSWLLSCPPRLGGFMIQSLSEMDDHLSRTDSNMATARGNNGRFLSKRKYLETIFFRLFHKSRLLSKKIAIDQRTTTKNSLDDF